MFRRFPRARVAAFVSLACLALGACEEGEEPGAAEPTTRAGLTAPGTDLEFGEAAMLPRSGSSGTVELSVTGVTTGDRRALERAGYRDVERRTPYYVHYTVRFVSGSSPFFELVDYVSLRADDQVFDHVSTFARFTPCREVVAGAGTTTESTLDGCAVYVTDGATEPGEVVFRNGDQYDDEATDVSWS